MRRCGDATRFTAAAIVTVAITLGARPWFGAGAGLAFPLSLAALVGLLIEAGGRG